MACEQCGHVTLIVKRTKCALHKIMETGIGQHALFALPLR